MQILVVVDKLDAMDEHPLALLAEEIKKLLKKESTIFTPILSQRNPQAIVVSASLVHKLYGNKLVRMCTWLKVQTPECFLYTVKA